MKHYKVLALYTSKDICITVSVLWTPIDGRVVYLRCAALRTCAEYTRPKVWNSALSAPAEHHTEEQRAPWRLSPHRVG